METIVVAIISGIILIVLGRSLVLAEIKHNKQFRLHPQSSIKSRKKSRDSMTFQYVLRRTLAKYGLRNIALVLVIYLTISLSFVMYFCCFNFLVLFPATFACLLIFIILEKIFFKVPRRSKREKDRKRLLALTCLVATIFFTCITLIFTSDVKLTLIAIGVLTILENALVAGWLVAFVDLEEIELRRNIFG